MSSFQAVDKLDELFLAVSADRVVRRKEPQNTHDQQIAFLNRSLLGCTVSDAETESNTDSNTGRVLDLDDISVQRTNYTCSLCRDKGFEIRSCLNCRMETEDIELTPVVRFHEVPTVEVYHPKAPIHPELIFIESDPMQVRKEVSLLDLPNMKTKGASSEDLRLAEIVDSYMSQPPTVSKPTFVERTSEKVKRAVREARAKVDKKYNPYATYGYDRLCDVLFELYVDSLCVDLSAHDDP